MGKVLATMLAALLFISNIAAGFTAFCTSLGDTYPGLQKYAAISMAVSAFLVPFLPRIQKFFDVVREYQKNI